MIVFCDGCNTPYHQYCHDPPISSEVIAILDKEWFCIECVKSKEPSPVKEDESQSIQVRDPSPIKPPPPPALASGEGLSYEQVRKQQGSEFRASDTTNGLGGYQ